MTLTVAALAGGFFLWKISNLTVGSDEHDVIVATVRLKGGSLDRSFLLPVNSHTRVPPIALLNEPGGYRGLEGERTP